jgi:hypothetical protein
MPPQRSFEINSTGLDERRCGGAAIASSPGECPSHLEHVTAAMECGAHEALAASRRAQQAGFFAASVTLAVFALQQACSRLTAQQPSRFAAATTNAGIATPFLRAHASFC